MSIWYRASQSKNIAAVFSGDGGMFTAARWNHMGRRVTYCSESISLCTLEWLSHNGLSVSGFNYNRYSIEIPKNLIKKFLPEDLPKEWNKTPATDMSRDFAEKNLFLSDKFIAMAVPSVLVPEEFNLVINPSHKNYNKMLETVKKLGQHTAPVRLAVNFIES